MTCLLRLCYARYRQLDANDSNSQRWCSCKIIKPCNHEVTTQSAMNAGNAQVTNKRNAHAAAE